MSTPGPSKQQRAEILDQNLMAVAANGGRVQNRTETQAVVVKGKPVGHVLHVILSLLSCGWWVPVWLLLTALGGEKRSTLTVSGSGTVNEVKQPMEPYRIVLLAIAAAWLLGWVLFFGAFVSAFSS